MLGLSPLGAIHTAISLVALAAGAIALLRTGAIAWKRNTIYVWATILTCLTGFGIFHHGGFGKPHALGIITLLVMGVAYAAAQGRFGGRAAAVETVALSLSFYFHLIPGMTETSLRLPVGHPLAASPEEPWLQAASGVLFLGFLLVAWLQIRRLRGAAVTPAQLRRAGSA